MNYKEQYEALCAKIAETIPGFEIKYKTDSKLQKVIGTAISFFNPRYLTTVTTTASPVVWFPSKEYVENDYQKAFNTLAHEFVHLCDQSGRKGLFNCLYLFPQVLSLVGLAGLAGLWYTPLYWLLALLLLAAPLPAPWRVRYERRAYTMSMAVQLWRYGYMPASLKEGVAAKFYGSAYYWMLPTRDGATDLVNAAVQGIPALLAEEGRSNRAYRVVHAIIKEKATDVKNS